MSAIPQEFLSEISGRYRVVEELAVGGMGTVYLALDLKHNRDVALKVLRPEVGRVLGQVRFLREIEISANLTHPHILPLHDSGGVGDHLYYVMPLVVGGTLQDRISREARLSLEDAVRVTVEVASGLQHAHDHGVVHRDVKPANILFQEGHALVTDFGVARAASPADQARITTGGVSVGTPVYMSAQQGLGEEVDHRADQYSLACVCYEMLAGTVPFNASTPRAIIARHAVDPVPSLRTVRGGVPAGVEAAIMRALAKDPEDRFPSVETFAQAVSAAASEEAVAAASASAPLVRAKLLRRMLGYAGVAATVVAGVVLMDRLIPSGESGSRPGVQSESIPRLVVLPFDNVGSPEDDFFAEGMSEEVQSRMASLSGVRVISHATASTLGATDPSPTDLFRELGVEYVLRGTIRTDRAPDGTGSMQVIPHLSRLPDDIELYSDRINVTIEPGRLFAAQAVIAEQVAAALNVSLLLPERLTLQERPTDNLEAYEAYLRGNVYASQRFMNEPSRLAIEMYARAVELDPSFSLAQARLAQAYAFRNFYFGGEAALAHAHLDRAFTMDSTSVDTRLAQGFVSYFVDLDYAAALRILEPLRRTQANNASLQWLLGSVKRRLGDWEGAVAALRRATELDPRSHTYAARAAVALYSVRQYEEADDHLGRALSVAPDYLAGRTARAWLQVIWRGDLEAARSIVEEGLEYSDVTDVVVHLIGSQAFLPLLDEPFQEALEQVSPRTHAVEPVNYHLARAGREERRGDTAAAAQHFDSARVALEARRASGAALFPYPPMLAYTLAGLGRAEQARAAADTIESFLRPGRDAVNDPTLLFWVALARMRSGDVDGGVDLIEELLQRPGFVSRPLLRAHPLFDPYRGHPGFQGLVRGSGNAR